ncbi:MAG: hypothetical protein ABIQ88_04745 [Chitinophagaceae bacterium]
MKLMLIAGSLVLLLTACTKQGGSPDCCVLPAVEMVRTQTQCADAWGYGNTAEATITRLADYLSQKNIATSKITILATGETLVCDACTCSKGFVFHVWTASKYIADLKKEGFIIH